MKFDLKNSKLLFEVRYTVPGDKESYTYEMLYKTKDNKSYLNLFNFIALIKIKRKKYD